METFYMIYVLGKHGPTKRHDTISSASLEATRLAKQHPETLVYVLEVHHAVIAHVSTELIGVVPRHLTCDHPMNIPKHSD